MADSIRGRKQQQDRPKGGGFFFFRRLVMTRLAQKARPSRRKGALGEMVRAGYFTVTVKVAVACVLAVSLPVPCTVKV